MRETATRRNGKRLCAGAVGLAGGLRVEASEPTNEDDEHNSGQNPLSKDKEKKKRSQKEMGEDSDKTTAMVAGKLPRKKKKISVRCGQGGKVRKKKINR